jgi:hypothetical protein
MEYTVLIVSWFCQNRNSIAGWPLIQPDPRLRIVWIQSQGIDCSELRHTPRQKNSAGHALSIHQKLPWGYFINRTLFAVSSHLSHTAESLTSCVKRRKEWPWSG